MKPIIRQLMLLIIALSSSFAYAYEFSDNGIYYNIISEGDQTVEVTSGPVSTVYTSDSINIPAKCIADSKTWKVVKIGNKAFYASKISSVTIPNSVTEIGSLAFGYSHSLTNVIIPNSVTKIGEEAFKGCDALKNITIPSSATDIGEAAFLGIREAINVDTNNPAFTSKDGVLYNADMSLLITAPSQIKEITLPIYVTEICGRAFEDCQSLTNVTMPNSVTKIGYRAFYGCRSLTDVTIPNSVTYISESAFVGCSSLTNITIPNSVTYIGKRAFAGCSSLTNVIIPNSVTTIENHAFYGCSSLTNVTLPNSITTIVDNVFSECSSLKSITIPPSVTAIQSGAFNVDTLIISSSNTTLYMIPKKLTTLYCKSILPPAIQYGQFTNEQIKNLKLYVPRGYKANYEMADPWRNLWNIEEMDYIPLGSISIDKTELSIKIDETQRLNLSFNPEDNTDKTTDWISSDETIAVVNSAGFVKGISAGEATITVNCGDCTVVCNVTVKGNEIPVESIDLDKNEVNLGVKETVQLTATVNPEDATDKTVTWISDNTAVATVSETGLITALSVGESTVSATCGKQTATCRVIVKDISGIDDIPEDLNEKVDVYSILGTKVRTGIMRADLTKLPKGIYIIRSPKRTYKIAIHNSTL